MAKVKLFTKSYCPFCHHALGLLKELNADFENIEVDNGNEEWDKMKEKTGHFTVPMIFIGDEFIGGFSELEDLRKSEKLSDKLK
jgi:glutaredoxin 3